MLMNTNAEVLNEIVNERRSVRIYDEKHNYDKSIVERSLHRAILSPNSSNMQLWEFYRITSQEKKAKIAHFCLDQIPAKTAHELVVFVARPDKYKQSIKFNLDLINSNDSFEKESRRKKRKDYYKNKMPLFYTFDFLFVLSTLKKLFVTLVGLKTPTVREVTSINKKVTIHKSIALAAQTFMLSVKAEGYDTCPLEGFDSKRIKKLLGLPRKAEINMVVACGKAANDGIWYPRKRYEYNEVVKEL